jgi:hypothetical protein
VLCCAVLCCAVLGCAGMWGVGCGLWAVGCGGREHRDWAERWGLQPRTPDRHQSCSKRSWDGQIRKWRKLLHQWDTVPPVPIDINALKKQNQSEGRSPYAASPFVGSGGSASGTTPARSPAPYASAKSPYHMPPQGNVSFRNLSDNPSIGPKVPAAASASASSSSSASSAASASPHIVNEYTPSASAAHAPAYEDLSAASAASAALASAAAGSGTGQETEAERDERERQQALQMAALIADGADTAASASSGGALASASASSIGGADNDELVFHD